MECTVGAETQTQNKHRKRIAIDPIDHGPHIGASFSDFLEYLCRDLY